MKLLALNVCRGGGSRVKALCQFLDQHNPDVIVLTEWRQGAAGQGLSHGWKPEGFTTPRETMAPRGTGRSLQPTCRLTLSR